MAVLDTLVADLSTGWLVTEVYVGTFTVKNHVRRIFRKLGVDTRVDAVLYAIEYELDRT